MKSVLLIGVGRYGAYLVKTMNSMGNDVMAVDRSEEHINHVMEDAARVAIGDATDPKFLETLGVSNFDLCIVGIGDNFQASLEVTSLLKEMGAKTVVSRAVSAVHEKFLLRNGADDVVYPERQLAEWTAVCYSSENVFDYFELDGDNAIMEVTVHKEWVGKSLLQLNMRRKYSISVIGIKEGDKFNTKLDVEKPFEADDHLLVIGEKEVLWKLFR